MSAALRPAPTLARAAAAAAPSPVREVDEAELEVLVASRTAPMVIDFYATWCGPCVLMAQELTKLGEALGERVTILKIDVDKNENIASALKIEGLPTLVLVPAEQDRPAMRLEGLLPAEALADICEKEFFGAGEAAGEAAAAAEE